MRAAAELARVGLVGVAGGDHADDLAVLLAEEGDGAGRLGLVDAHDLGDDGLGGEDLGVDEALDALELIGRHGLEVREVEAETVGRYERACLVDVVAEHLLECGVEQVGGGVVATDELAPAVVDPGLDLHADGDGSLLDGAVMGDEPALVVLGAVHADVRGGTDETARVAHLTSHLAVEGRAVEHDRDLLALLRTTDRLAVPHDGDDLAADEVVGVVALEVGGGQLVGERHPDVVVGTPCVAVGLGAAAVLLGLHLAVEGVHVDVVAGAARDLAGEVDGEAVGVVELEGHLAGEHLSLPEALELRGEARLARVERGAEALLLGRDDAVDEGLLLHELGIHVTEDARDLVGVGGEEGAANPHEAAMVDRATEQAAQDVAAALVRGEDAVADHEGNGAGVVGDDAQALVGRAVLVVGHAGEALPHPDEGAQDVALVVGPLVLHDRGDALEAHAGVDVAMWEVGHRAVLLAVVLREDEVPELEVAVAVVAGLLALERGALVEVDLGAGAAGAGGAGRPEVVLGTEARDVVEGHALRVPEVDGLVVILEDRHVETVRGEAEVVRGGDELVGPGDGVCLAVASEGEVAEHLEEREVTGVADVVDVVGAQALLAGGRTDLPPGLRALVVLLELVHAGVGEKERRVVGNERRGGIQAAALRLEEAEEVLADLCGGHGLIVERAHGSPHTSMCVGLAYGSVRC